MAQSRNSDIKQNLFIRKSDIKHLFKLILIDIDGTLTKDSSTISPKIKKLIKKNQGKIMISLISSRSRKSAYKFIKLLKLRSYHILENGAVVIDPNFKSVRTIFIQKSILTRIYELLKINESCFNVCIDGVTKYFNNTNDFNGIPFNRVTRVSIINLKKNQLTEIDTQLKSIDRINYYRVIDKSKSSSWNIDITSNFASKSTASKFLFRHLKISKSQTIGIGDGYNDLPFIKNVNIKIAMGNAVKELKAIADIVVPSVNQDGLAYALDMIYNKLLP